MSGAGLMSRADSSVVALGVPLPRSSSAHSLIAAFNGTWSTAEVQRCRSPG